MIRVEVAFALPDQQFLLELYVKEGCTAEQALEQSGLKSQFPDVDFSAMDMGIFSRLLDGRASPAPCDYIMSDGDRLELYRPLLIDPKRARLQRAAKKKKLRTG